MIVRDSYFSNALGKLREMMKRAPEVRTERWQGRDVSSDPSAATHELLNVRMDVDLRGTEDLDFWRDDIRPNLPWADDHFLERVGGEPLNPGVQWANWPWAKSADTFREGERFNHTYMERLWPKYARQTDQGRLPFKEDPGDLRKSPPEYITLPHRGIAWEYGDLQDLVEMLVAEPYTRQAWIPLFFPEDTGVGDGGRKPCTLGYQFIVRGGHMHVWYPLRSCDLVRHLPDDIYLAVRLLLWVIDQCRDLGPERGFWDDVKPGMFSMHMTSLHVFANDMINLRKGEL